MRPLIRTQDQFVLGRTVRLMHVYCTDKIRVLLNNSHSPVDVAEHSLPTQIHTSIIKSKQSSSPASIAFSQTATDRKRPNSSPLARQTRGGTRGTDTPVSRQTTCPGHICCGGTKHKVIWVTGGRAERRRCRIPPYFLTRISRYRNYPHVVKKVREEGSRREEQRVEDTRWRR